MPTFLGWDLHNLLEEIIVADILQVRLTFGLQEVCLVILVLRAFATCHPPPRQHGNNSRAVTSGTFSLSRWHFPPPGEHHYNTYPQIILSRNNM